MNIAMVGGFALYPKGTMSARALPLAQALSRLGHHVTMLLPPWDHPEDAGQALNRGGVLVVNTRLPRQVPLWWHTALTTDLVSKTLALRPHVVHTFKPKGFSGLVALNLDLLRKAGRFHGRLVVDTDDREGASGWNQAGGYNLLERALFSWQERWLLTHADAVTAASHPLVDLALQLRGGRQDVYYLPNGGPACPSVDCQRGKALRQQLELGQAPVVLWFTRFIEMSPDRVVDLLAQIAQRCPQVKFLVVGAGLRGEEKLFHRSLVGAGLAAMTVQTGWIAPEDLVDYFSAADVAIYPLEENPVNQAKCPAKLARLLSHGLPVVASAVGQAREYIAHGESGLLVPGGSSEAFAESVGLLLRDVNLRQRLAHSARERMRSLFGWDILVKQAQMAYGL